MSPSIRDLQLTPLAGGGIRKSNPPMDDHDSADLEDVRLLDSYDSSHSIVVDDDGRGGGEEDGMRRIQVRITGMTCAACSNSVESALMGVIGVRRASVALLQNKADVIFDPALI
ncbi:Copper-transporting ATPase RAN1 [Euphorbia peplus]|nr:Copper-transporting ATPase RAN1 [Euphorbia peplus]